MSNTCLEALNRAVDTFRSKGTDRPRTNAELLLGAVLNVRKIDLYLNRDRTLALQEVQRFEQFIRERLSGKPVQYIIGSTEFFGLELKVDPSVLIPRPETETLVETVLENLGRVVRPRIIDIGTGSGAIAVSLATNLDGSYVYATDVSSEALKVAQENARKHDVQQQIEFLCGDLFEPLKEKKLEGKINCVVSNPPYVSAEEFETLPKEVKDFEPIVALKTDEQGLSFHRKIAENALDFLSSGGILALEVGLGQSGKVADLIRAQDGFSEIEIRKDLGGIERIILVRKA
jgi:release factor glutamine methyltransferase